MISESESKEILEKFVKNNGMLKEYPALMTVPGDMNHKRRVLEYLEGWGLIESFNHMDWAYYSITKKGLRLIDRIELEEKTEAEPMSHDGTMVSRHNELLEAIKKKPGISTSELLIDEEHQSTTHNRLNQLIEMGKIEKRKKGNKNVYFLMEDVPKRKETEIVIDQDDPQIPDGNPSSEPAPDSDLLGPIPESFIDEISDLPEEHAQLLLEIFKHLPSSWTQFEGKHNQFNNSGYLKIFVKDVDDCVDYYNAIKKFTPEKPKLDIHSKNQANYVKVPLPMEGS